jgi:Homeodomain-like domain
MIENDSLSVNQQKAIAALLAGSSVADVAETANVSQETIYRWKRLEKFRRALRQGSDEILRDSIADLKILSRKAVEALARNMPESGDKVSPIAQVQAAKASLGTAISVTKLEERIAELEAQLAEREQEHENILKFDARKLTREERETLRRIHADIAEREAHN